MAACGEKEHRSHCGEKWSLADSRTGPDRPAAHAPGGKRGGLTLALLLRPSGLGGCDVFSKLYVHALLLTSLEFPPRALLWQFRQRRWWMRSLGFSYRRSTHWNVFGAQNANRSCSARCDKVFSKRGLTPAISPPAVTFKLLWRSNTSYWFKKKKLLFFLTQAPLAASSTACCWMKRTPPRKGQSLWRPWKVTTLANASQFFPQSVVPKY